MYSKVKHVVFLKLKFHYIFVSVDHTRVKLKDVDPHVLGAEYINANYIKVTYISVISCNFFCTRNCVYQTGHHSVFVG
jgi:protein tyrosine phosphatase